MTRYLRIPALMSMEAQYHAVSVDPESSRGAPRLVKTTKVGFRLGRISEAYTRIINGKRIAAVIGGPRERILRLPRSGQVPRRDRGSRRDQGLCVE